MKPSAAITCEFSISFVGCGIEQRWWSAFILAGYFDFLRGCGEHFRDETKLAIWTDAGWQKLEQFQQAASENGCEARITATGPSAVEFSRNFSDFVQSRAKGVRLDSDGYVVV